MDKNCIFSNWPIQIWYLRRVLTVDDPWEVNQLLRPVRPAAALFSSAWSHPTNNTEIMNDFPREIEGGGLTFLCIIKVSLWDINYFFTVLIHPIPNFILVYFWWIKPWIVEGLEWVVTSSSQSDELIKGIRIFPILPSLTSSTSSDRWII